MFRNKWSVFFSAVFCILQQRIELLAAHLDDGTMLVVGGHADTFGDGGESQEVAGRYGAVFLRMVLVEVDDPLVAQLEGAGSFGISAAEGRGWSGAGRSIVGGVEWAVGRVAEDAEEVAESRLAVVLDDEDASVRAAADSRRCC